MATLASPQKRSLHESGVVAEVTEPTTKKLKILTSIPEEKSQNGKSESNKTEKKKNDNEDSSWAIDPNKKPSDFRNYTNSKRQETVKNFHKEQRAKMTYEVVLKKQKEHLAFNKCVMTVWEMLHYLDRVVDESDPDTNLTQIEHAIQTSEAARRACPGPEYDWFHVLGLIHDLGKVLAVVDESKNFKGEPQWCVVGDTFPVGCQFSETNVFYDYFRDNPDSQNAKYNTFYGIYKPKCGLDKVVMSWGHDEYMYQIAKSQSKLPQEALYVIRFHSFYPWHNKHGYMHLCDDKDLEYLKWVKKFQKCDLYSKSQVCPKLADIEHYYKPILQKYFPEPVHW